MLDGPWCLCTKKVNRRFSNNYFKPFWCYFFELYCLTVSQMYLVTFYCIVCYLLSNYNSQCWRVGWGKGGSSNMMITIYCSGCKCWTEEYKVVKYFSSKFILWYFFQTSASFHPLLFPKRMVISENANILRSNCFSLKKKTPIHFCRLLETKQSKNGEEESFSNSDLSLFWTVVTYRYQSCSIFSFIKVS